MKSLSFDHFFSNLGNKNRMSILQFLSAHGPKSVSEICLGLEMEQSAVSHNMKRLLTCHFVEVEQKGKERIYSINEETIKPLLNLIEKHVSQNCIKSCNHE